MYTPRLSGASSDQKALAGLMLSPCNVPDPATDTSAKPLASLFNEAVKRGWITIDRKREGWIEYWSQLTPEGAEVKRKLVAASGLSFA